jgi:hypothetical protein
VERTARTALTGATTGVPTRVDMANIFVCYVCVCQNGKAGGDAIEGGFGFSPGSSSHIALRGNLSRSYWSRTRLIYWPQSPWGINSRK